jgi:rRNA processing protein Gar1
LKKSWVKLNLIYIGKSKKHQIFRAKQWNKSLEKILKKPIFNENYQKVGVIKDIFGPVNLPFISIKTLPNQEFGTKIKLYANIS